MRVDRAWAMPNKYTFTIPVIVSLLTEEMPSDSEWVDPFCGMKSPATVTNDLDETLPATYHLDGLEFLRTLTAGVDGVLFDPPYSTEQALRKYKAKYGGTAGRAEYWARCLDEIARIVRPGGKAICFGWNSNGCGKKRGFVLERVLLVAHGGCHPMDTIITVEVKQ